MKRTTTTATGLLVLMLAIPSGAALHCNGDITTISAGGETMYIDDRSDTAGEIDHWIYLESNGLEGLQSGDRGVLIEEHCVLDLCWSMDEPCAHANFDTLIL